MDNRKKCPFCGEMIAVNARKCRFCGEWLQEVPKPAAGQATRPAVSPGLNPARPAATRPQPTQPVQQPAQPAYQPQQPSNQAPQQPPKSSGLQIETGNKEKSFFEAYFMDSFLRRYADFSGLTSRSEFWLTYVAMCVASVAITGLFMLIAGAGGVTGMIVGAIIASLAGLALTVPGMAICCRRLRDAGFSPWMILISLVPALGSIALLIMLALPSKYEHEPVKSRFNLYDILITAAAVLLLGFGIWMSLKSLGGGIDSPKYDLGEEDYAVEEVSDFGDNETVQDEVELVDSYGTSINGVDESLLDILYSPEEALSGRTSLVTYRMGKDYDRVASETGSTHQFLHARGMISDHDVDVECFLTENGELHGRYHHENGTRLDLNGYIQPDGDLYIQLGHDSEKSEWRLHPVSDEISGTYRYEGTWGRSNKSSFLVFTVDDL